MQTLVREFSANRQYESCLFLQISGNIASPNIVNRGYMDGHDIVKALSQKPVQKDPYSRLPTSLKVKWYATCF